MVAGAVVVVGRMGVVVVVVDGFTVDDVEELELLVELDVELVDDVDPRLVPSSVFTKSDSAVARLTSNTRSSLPGIARQASITSWRIPWSLR